MVIDLFWCLQLSVYSLLRIQAYINQLKSEYKMTIDWKSIPSNNYRLEAFCSHSRVHMPAIDCFIVHPLKKMNEKMFISFKSPYTIWLNHSGWKWMWFIHFSIQIITVTYLQSHQRHTRTPLQISGDLLHTYQRDTHLINVLFLTELHTCMFSENNFRLDCFSL